MLKRSKLLGYYHFAVARRFSAYQTSGELFREIEKDSLQLSMSEHIWRIITELVAEILTLDPEELILELVSENKRLPKFINIEPLRRGRGLVKVEIIMPRKEVLEN